MQIYSTTPNIIKIHVNQERTDEDYGSCLWYEATIDLDAWRLSIDSDVGSYCYSWNPNQRGTFPQLLHDMNADYLLGKLSDRTTFQYEESVNSTLENIEQSDRWDDLSKDEQKEIISHAKYIGDEYRSSVDAFYMAMSEHLHSYGFDSEDISYHTDYPAQAYKAVEILTQHVLPYIRQHYLPDTLIRNLLQKCSDGNGASAAAYDFMVRHNVETKKYEIYHKNNLICTTALGITDYATSDMERCFGKYVRHAIYGE